MTNNHKPPKGVGEAAILFGDNDNNNVDEVNGRPIGGHSSRPTTNLSPPERVDGFQNINPSSQTKENDKGESSNPSTTPTHPTFPNTSNIFDSYLRSQNQLSSTTQPEKLSMETAWRNTLQSERDYYHAGVNFEAQNKGLLLQQQSEQNQLRRQRQSNGESSFASPIDQRPSNAPPVEINHDFYLFHSELNAPPTPISIPSSPSAGPLMPVFNSFDPNDEDMEGPSARLFPPLSSIQRRPTTSSLRNSLRDSGGDNTSPGEFGFSLF